MKLALPARPLRFDASRLLVPLAVLPGLVMAVAHAPVALLTFGPLVLSSWVFLRRERFRLDRCVVEIDGPALELRYGLRRLCGVDLRYATRLLTAPGDIVLAEGDGDYLVFGTDPPDNAYPLAQGGDGEVLHGAWRAVRLHGDDLARLQQALLSISPQPQPDPADPRSLLEALGSVGRWGARAEAHLGEHLRGETGHDRPGGLTLALQELSLRQDPVGQAARRVLAGARRA